MTAKDGANWQATLAEVERSIDDCLAALAKYESAFAKVLHEPVPPVPSRPLPAPTAAWDDTLADAARRTDEVEQLLDEQERVWGRWRQALGQWQRTLDALPPGTVGRTPLTATATTAP
ncbi:MAG: hypothetical protein KF873_15355 [Gemmataceae bacterium]|nr:hypothetical protein [Gemmataceae bacterium]